MQKLERNACWGSTIAIAEILEEIDRAAGVKRQSPDQRECDDQKRTHCPAHP